MGGGVGTNTVAKARGELEKNIKLNSSKLNLFIINNSRFPIPNYLTTRTSTFCEGRLVNPR